MSASWNPEPVNRDVARRRERLAVAMREFETLSLAVSHDFRWPLKEIEQTVCTLGENHRPLDPLTARGLLAIRDNVVAMQGMIEDLLELCAQTGQPLDLEPLDMEALIREAWQGIEGHGRVELNVERLPVARGHRRMLALVWANLLSNAARRSFDHERPCVEVTGGDVGEFAVYSVAHNGAGFDLDYAGKLFYVFQEIQRQSDPGTGVRLAMVQRIVTRHRGNLWIEAHRGRGGRFRFSLPLGELDGDAR